jgi:glutathione S-transferase
MTTAQKPLPVLWQMRLSIFSEKARWALDYKGIAHRRRRVLSGLHPMTLRLRGRGKTVPVLELDGQTLCDSTDIIDALERHRPTPPLYPRDPAERDRALALEEFFDENCGHELRRVTLDPMLSEQALVRRYFLADQPALIRASAPVILPLFKPVLRRSYGITEETVGVARDKLKAAFDRLESEIGGGGYLVGDRFSVADLTAAAILGHLVLPRNYPYPTWAPEDLPPALRELRSSFASRPGFDWVLEMYERHRGQSAEAA